MQKTGGGGSVGSHHLKKTVKTQFYFSNRKPHSFSRRSSSARNHFANAGILTRPFQRKQFGGRSFFLENLR